MKRWFRSFFGVIVGASLIALSVRLFLIEDYRISSSSMFPTLRRGDLVFVSKLAYNIHLPFSAYEVTRLHRPQRGEIVVFSLPEHGIETYVKRVVAVEGDKVAIHEDKLFINGTVATYAPYTLKDEDARPGLRIETINNVSYPIEEERNGQDYGPVDVPPGHFFALGDNRPDSVDSRTWGPIPYSCLKGRVALVWLSLRPEGGLRGDRVGLWIQ